MKVGDWEVLHNECQSVSDLLLARKIKIDASKAVTPPNLLGIDHRYKYIDINPTYNFFNFPLYVSSS